MRRDGVFDIAICTTGTSLYLYDAILSACRELSLQGNHGKCLVVLNTDRSLQLPELPEQTCVVREAQAGLSFARNRAFIETNAPFVAFIDDDAVVRSGWGAAVAELIDKVAHLGIGGGPVNAVWEPQFMDIPSWPKSVKDYIGSHVDRTWVGIHMSGPTVGANMVINREAFSRVGGFDPELGRRGALPIGMEEVTFRGKVATAGFTIASHAEMCVDHHVKIERLRVSRVLKRYWYEGLSWRLAGIVGKPYVRQRLIQLLFGNISNRWSGSARFDMPFYCELAFLSGVLFAKPR